MDGNGKNLIQLDIAKINFFLDAFLEFAKNKLLSIYEFLDLQDLFYSYAKYNLSAD